MPFSKTSFSDRVCGFIHVTVYVTIFKYLCLYFYVEDYFLFFLEVIAESKWDCYHSLCGANKTKSQYHWPVGTINIIPHSLFWFVSLSNMDHCRRTPPASRSRRDVRTQKSEGVPQPFLYKSGNGSFFNNLKVQKVNITSLCRISWLKRSFWVYYMWNYTHTDLNTGVLFNRQRENKQTLTLRTPTHSPHFHFCLCIWF